MKKYLKKLKYCLLVITLILSCLITGFKQVNALQSNIALHKPVTTSSVRPKVSHLTGALAVDGVDDDEESRWSSKMATGKGENEGNSEDGAVEQWLTIDLQGEYDISEIYISWEGAYAKSYKVQTSVNNIDFNDIYINTKSAGGKQTIQKNMFLDTSSARYVRILCLEPYKSTWGYSIFEVEINGNQKDNKNVVLNEGVVATTSGTESNSNVLTANKAIDGITGVNESRWSGAKSDNQWLIVDLQKSYLLEQINVDFFREASDYTIEISKDGINYKEILRVENNSQINIENVREIVFEKQEVQYIKFNQTKMFTSNSNNQKYSASIYEIEAYQNAIKEQVPQNAKSVLTYIENEGITLPDESGQKIIFSKEITDNFDVEIYGSDYKTIVGMDGTFYRPLVGKNIHLMYKVINKKDNTDIAISTKDNTIFVQGQYENSGKNAAPTIIPSLQEWYGGEDVFKLTSTSKIIYNDSRLKQKAELLATYINNLLNKKVVVQLGSQPTNGDIYLEFNNDKDIKVLGEEGYLLNIDNYITIQSSSLNGMFYGGVSIVQALYLNLDTLTVNKGIARDYPKYEVRSMMIDIARSEIQLDYIKEITEMLPFFKINEIVLHINDDRGDKISDTNIGSKDNIEQTKDLSSFRIENDKNIGDHAYQISKEDYIQYQKEAQKYGVTVVTELDTPAHSAVFSLIDGMAENMFDVRHLKILDNPNVAVKDVKLYQPTIDFIDEITEELIGSKPGEAVIQNPVFHFGTDEYKNAPVYSEAMQQYINHYVDFIQSRGYEARAWASSDGSSGFKGYVTPQNKEVTYYLWAPYWADVKKTLANGNPIINCSGSSLYIVPGGNNGYSNYLNLSKLYNNWSVNDITTTRGSGGATIPISHPQLRGASVVLWNDDGFLLDGISDFDLYDRLKEGFPIIAERTWYGEKTEGQNYDDFKSVSDYLLKKGPTSNPSRYVESKDETIVKYDFETIQENTVIDSSHNHYDASLTSSVVRGKDGNAMKLDGDSYLKLPFDTVGFPASVSLDLCIDNSTKKDATLFQGKDGSIHLNQKDKNGQYTNKLGYERDGYTYVFDYQIPTDKWVNITITSDRNGTKLYVNNQFKSYGKRTEFGPYVKKDLSTTMVLPTEKIGEGIVGKIDNLIIYNSSLNIAEPQNIAPQAIQVTTSNNFNEQFTGINAIDSSKTTRWATTNDVTQATLELDFGKEVKINSSKIIEYKATNNYIKSYNIEYWNGQEWLVGWTHQVSDQEITAVSGVANGYSIEGEFDTITASKVRLNITSASRPSIYEFELYYIEEDKEEIDKLPLEKLIVDIESLDKNKYTIYSFDNLEQVYIKALGIFVNPEASQDEVDSILKLLNEAKNKLDMRANITEAKKLLEKIEDNHLNEDQYVASSWKEFIKSKEILENAINNNSYINQSEIDKACQTLEEALSKLIYKKADYSKIDKLLKTINALDKNLYENFADVEEAVQSIVRGLDITKQSDVDQMFKDIQDAFDGLIKVNYNDLETLYTTNKELEEGKFTKETWEAFTVVMEKAHHILSNKTSKQAEVDKVLDDLQKAIQNLEIKKPILSEEPDNSGNIQKPTKPVIDEKINHNVLGDMIDTTKTTNTKTNDVAIIMPYAILAIVSVGIYIFIRKKESM